MVGRNWRGRHHHRGNTSHLLCDGLLWLTRTRLKKILHVSGYVMVAVSYLSNRCSTDMLINMCPRWLCPPAESLEWGHE